MEKDVLYKCIMPFWVGDDEFEVIPGSKWSLSPSAPEGYDVALETLEEDSYLQIWMDYGRLDKYFVKED